MSDTRKKRLSMLDSLATAAPAPPASATTANRALRSARDAVDSHHVWELDPDQIDDGRITDRMDLGDIAELRDAIEANGQTVPILVRRSPHDPSRYLLVYGRRRLEAIRASDKVSKVRALVAKLEDDDAVRAQISENMARHDLSFIEKAVFARELLESGFGTQSQIAEILTVTKSSVSMALAIVDSVGIDLIRVIGAANGVGRPRWEALGTAIETSRISRDDLMDIAERASSMALVAAGDPSLVGTPPDPSLAAFEAVQAKVTPVAAATKVEKPARKADGKVSVPIVLGGETAGKLTRSAKGLKIELKDNAFGKWMDREVIDILSELHARFEASAED